MKPNPEYETLFDFWSWSDTAWTRAAEEKFWKDAHNYQLRQQYAIRRSFEG